MNDRAAGAPRVDAMLDRLGDKLSSDAQAKKPVVPRPLLGRIPAPAPPPRKAELPSASPTDPDPRASAQAAAAEVKSALDGPPYPEPASPADPLDGPPYSQAADPLDGPPYSQAADPLDGPPYSRATDPLDGPPFPPGAPSAPSPAEAAPYPPEPGVLERFPAADAMSVSALEDAPAEDTGTNDSLPPPGPSPIEGSGLAEPALPATEAAADEFAEFEKGELPADSTRIEDRELLADESTNMLREESRHPLLAVESGKDTGREFTLQEGETSVGRGIDNDIILTDVSVSRKHMRVLVDHEGITLIDLGSGNGTTLNGRRVHRALLGDGDRIEIGETVMVARLPGAKPDLYQQPTLAAPVESTSDEQLPSGDVHAPPAAWAAPYPVYPSAVPPPEPTPGRGTNILLGRGTLLLGAAMLVIIASMIGAIAMAFLLHEEPPTGVVGGPAVVPLPPAPPAVPSAATGSSAPLPPTTTAVLPPVLPPLAPTPPVAPPATTIPAVGTALPTPPGTSTATASSPEITPAASTSPGTTPPTPPPPTAEAAPPPPEAEEPPPRPQTAESPRGGSRERATPRAPSTPSARAVARPAGDQPDPRIVAAYRRQDFTGAAQLARTQADGVTGRQRTQLEQLARNIETFARRWPEARRGNFAAIEEAYRVDRRIVGGEGAFGSELAPRLVAGYLQRARASMASQPADACGDVRAAMTLSSGSAEARTLFRDCETRARRMLGEAQRLERNEPARARVIYGDVVSMLGTTHEIARDATARLVAMGRTTSTGPRARPVDEDE